MQSIIKFPLPYGIMAVTLIGDMRSPVVTCETEQDIYHDAIIFTLVCFSLIDIEPRNILGLKPHLTKKTPYPLIRGLFLVLNLLRDPEKCAALTGKRLIFLSGCTPVCSIKYRKHTKVI